MPNSDTRQCERRNARHFSAEQWRHVNTYLRLHLSPQQCSGRLKLEKAISISTESIYQHAYQDKATGGDLVRYLRCQKVRRKRYGSGQERRGTLKNRLCIEQRPAVVDKRSRLGDWEGDTVIGQGHQGVLVTLVERKSRYTLASQLDSRHSTKVTPVIIAQCLQAKVYFAHPYCSWE
ncbi:MAG: IS30 family transposase, partial [Pseudomonadota bacterium]